jgi:hypothetical protein
LHSNRWTRYGLEREQVRGPPSIVIAGKCAFRSGDSGCFLDVQAIRGGHRHTSLSGRGSRTRPQDFGGGGRARRVSTRSKIGDHVKCKIHLHRGKMPLLDGGANPMAFWPSSQLSQAHVKLMMEISSRWPQLFVRLMKQHKVHAIVGGSLKAKQHGNREARPMERRRER